MVPDRASLLTWSQQHRGTVALVIVAALGLALPSLLGGSLVRDWRATVGPIWLGLTLAFVVVALVARRGVARDLDGAVRRGLERVPAVPAAGGRPLDVPATGVVLARGLLDLGLLFLIQAMVRPALAVASDGRAPRALVDGVVVALVVLIALAMLMRLHRLNRSLVEHLCRAGLDALVPTAGFATPTRLPAAPPVAALAAPAASAPARVDPDSTPTRVTGSPAAPASETVIIAPAAATAASDQPTVVPRPASDQPTVVPAPASDQPTVVPAPAPEQPTVVPTPDAGPRHAPSEGGR
jgi:hypothetical protein